MLERVRVATRHGKASNPPVGHPESHRHLESLTKKVYEEFQRGNEAGILRAIRRFHSEVTQHIEEEERGAGLYDDMERKSPQLHSQLEHLRSQHREILALLKEIVPQLVLDSSIVLAQWQKCMMLLFRHEKDEEAAIDRVYFQEEGLSG